jgi:hypothetical protein
VYNCTALVKNIRKRNVTLFKNVITVYCRENEPADNFIIVFEKEKKENHYSFYSSVAEPPYFCAAPTLPFSRPTFLTALG